MTEIWFIRHGETDWNRVRRLQGWKDIPMNAQGDAQAQRLATRLVRDAETQPFAALYSSDLGRTLATAQPASEQLGLRVRPEPGLRERCYGVLEGLEAHRLEELAPAAYPVWASREVDGVIEGAETLRQFHSRVTSTVDDIAARHDGERILMVTHGGALDIIWRHAQGIRLDDPRRTPMLNVSVNRVTIEDGQWSMQSWGDVSHVSDAGAVGDDVVAGRAGI